ncbi:Nucleoside-diphosphate-sugar epimerase [Actinopolymorpha cephalotaxi]|uniref:Nucleoside-diphosphate-sugar epimerase n=1 Tax=Actinopolymorpha cephalotaxi TaxID=504797 RepID=A0A1I2PF67_9ACTN|nr:NAD(P)-dependent oxidoreductase [Actinopolymorpha cephalotaxi]NYH83713.1 nucleoside-diphosphate-sugar epimerase [Actinopolymorpha cephalotaxi]SFG12296.1 Nucleoside-diphosphate-sugar epimerase [Actinopolymorpha cephalotaxi]
MTTASTRRRVLVTGASGNAGSAVVRLAREAGFDVRMADVAPPADHDLRDVEFVRCDTRTPADVDRAVRGCDAVVHLAAWHCAHEPPVSDETIFAVNVDGTFNVVQACRDHGVSSVVFASSMAYGWGGVYGVTKVIGEDLWRMHHETTGASVALLRYHDFVPKPYLAWGAMLLRNGVDRRDVASATVAALHGVVEHKVDVFRTIVHTAHGMPAAVAGDFANRGRAWCDEQVPGSGALLERYGIALPAQVEQHDLTEAGEVLGWRPAYGIVDFLTDLRQRDARGEDVTTLWAPGQTPD